jgi:hypothetical protein
LAISGGLRPAHFRRLTGPLSHASRALPDRHCTAASRQ